jgi:cytochrome c556
MRKSITVMSAVLALGAIALGSINGAGVLAASGKEVIEERVTFMRNDILKPYLAIKKFTKEDVGTAAEVEKNAQLLGAAAAKIKHLFPKGTARGDFDAKITRSLPKIWEDWSGFEEAGRVLVAQAAKMAAVAAKGDSFDIGDQFDIMSKKGCGGCHKPFRGAKVK